MNTKDQFFEQNMKPLLDQLMDFAEQGGINVVVNAHYVEEGSDQDIIAGCRYYNDEKNGQSAHIVAISMLAQRPPEFAMAICKFAKLYDQEVQKSQQEDEAAAKPHGVAE